MNYNEINQQLVMLAKEEGWYVPLFANAAALLYESLPELNWAGFYLMKDGRLVLGPFQGKIACIHISLDRGVCGTAVRENRTVRVADVHQFPGHIACDSASNSEIVIPIRKDGNLVGVLDIDSPKLNRFDEADQEGLEMLVNILERTVQFDKFNSL